MATSVYVSVKLPCISKQRQWGFAHQEAENLAGNLCEDSLLFKTYLALELAFLFACEAIDMTALLQFCFLVGTFVITHGSESEKMETFIEAIIGKWKLRSPTLLIADDLPTICMNNHQLLCLSNEHDRNDLANHLASIHRQRKQDGLIIVGSQHHENLLKLLSEVSPSLLTSNNPVFMPISYQNYIQLRLDSNVIFYGDLIDGDRELYDIFAVKGGRPIKLEVGHWNVHHGMTLKKSLNRWDRRSNLHQTSFINCAAYNPGVAEFVTDEDGNIIGTKGYMQDLLFYITDKLNMKIEIIQAQWKNELRNGSWTGGIGYLQRQEADVVSSALGINIQRSHFIDFPMPELQKSVTLIAAKQSGVNINTWVYIRVFGVYQWFIFVIFLIVMAMGLSLLSKGKSGLRFGTKKGSKMNHQLSSISSAFFMVFLYFLQKGTHINSKQLAIRFMTTTISILTLLLFVFYTRSLIANMTVGPPSIPIRTFKDVIFHNYKVITYSSFYKSLLEKSKPGSAKYEVFNHHFEIIGKGQDAYEDKIEAYKVVIQDSESKTLFFKMDILVSRTDEEKVLTDQLFALKIDDSLRVIGGFALQNDSEFLQLFNYYIMKAYESGVIKRLFRKHHIDLYTKEIFQMKEPQPLGFNNVLFCFLSLGFGSGISLLIAIVELYHSLLIE